MSTATATSSADAPPSGKAVFSALMGEIGRKSTGWHAMIVMLSRLPVGEKRTALSASVVSAVEAGVTQPHGTLVLPNRDVLALVRDPSANALAVPIDIAARTLAAAALDPLPLIRKFDLSTELSKFIASVSGVDMGMTQRAAAPVPAVKAAAAAVAPADEPKKSTLPWDADQQAVLPKDINKIEKIFFKADVGNFIRNQTSYKLMAGKELEENHDEIFISIDYLVKFFAHQSISGDKWLFNYFTRTLDSRILRALGPGKEGEGKEITYSVNLNISTLFSEDFLIYDQAVPPRVRRGQIIELQAFDVVENSSELPFLHAFFRGRGYRMCIDGVDADLFQMIDWTEMEVDVIKLHWSPELAAREDVLAAKVQALVKSGKVEVVLCRCEDESALDWGASMGIPIYQGWYLDGLKKARTSDQPKPRYKLRERNMVY